jgi:hypothetical protein
MYQVGELIEMYQFGELIEMYQFGRLIIEMYQFLAKKIIAPEKARKQS